jgi:hypothetical protein
MPSVYWWWGANVLGGSTMSGPTVSSLEGESLSHRGGEALSRAALSLGDAAAAAVAAAAAAPRDGSCFFTAVVEPLLDCLALDWDWDWDRCMM